MSDELSRLKAENEKLKANSERVDALGAEFIKTLRIHTITFPLSGGSFTASFPSEISIEEISDITELFAVAMNAATRRAEARAALKERSQ